MLGLKLNHVSKWGPWCQLPLNHPKHVLNSPVYSILYKSTSKSAHIWRTNMTDTIFHIWSFLYSFSTSWTHLIILLRCSQPWTISCVQLLFRGYCWRWDRISIIMDALKIIQTTKSIHYFVFSLYHRTIAGQSSVSLISSSSHWPRTL